MTPVAAQGSRLRSVPRRLRRAVGPLLGGVVGVALALVSGLSRLGEDLVVHVLLGRFADAVVRSLERLLPHWRPTFEGR
ncbi:hypothetical protein [Streptomyces sp. NPDC056987]|uniref:hypothetical protein n=1 Tax=Streptomyces sp. NPDC056987 TaxID=3345988 RepID=UPI00362F68DD